MANILDRRGVESLHRICLQFEPQWSHHAAAKFGARGILDSMLGLLERAHDPHDLADGDPAAFARQSIAASGPTHANENAGAHQLLQDLLEIATRNALTLGNLGRLHR